MVSIKRHIFPIVISIGVYYTYYTFIYTKPGPIVETKSGKVQGITVKSREGREYHEFLGIFSNICNLQTM